jgi:hypothetical protein
MVRDLGGELLELDRGLLRVLRQGIHDAGLGWAWVGDQA